MAHPSIGIVIPTFQAQKHLPCCLPPLIASSLKPRLLIIDSSSTDETVLIAKRMGVETLVIPKHEFNHGATREKGRSRLKTDIVVMMTQDAYAVSSDTLEELLSPLIQGKASIAYARQLPHEGAGFFESFPRSFNYPSTSHIRGLQDIDRYGAYTFFCSNSCAAYLNAALDEIGGFPDVLFGEDALVVAQLLRRRHQIAYVASAEVRHSHEYSLKQEFSRHFDMGLARHLHQELLNSGEKDAKRGKAYVQAMLTELKRSNPALIPYALLQSCVKFIGYRLGGRCLNAPVWLKKRAAANRFIGKKNNQFHGRYELSNHRQRARLGRAFNRSRQTNERSREIRRGLCRSYGRSSHWIFCASWRSDRL